MWSLLWTLVFKCGEAYECVTHFWLERDCSCSVTRTWLTFEEYGNEMHSYIEDIVLLGASAASVHNWVPTFRENVVPSSFKGIYSGAVFFTFGLWGETGFFLTLLASGRTDTHPNVKFASRKRFGRLTVLVNCRCLCLILDGWCAQLVITSLPSPSLQLPLSLSPYWSNQIYVKRWLC
jgi:hypothetical protein